MLHAILSRSRQTKKRKSVKRKSVKRKSVKRKKQRGGFASAVAFTGAPWSASVVSGDRNYYPLNPYTSGDARPQLQQDGGKKRRRKSRKKTHKTSRSKKYSGGGFFGSAIDSVMYNVDKTMSTLRGEPPGPNPDPSVQPSTQSLLTDGRSK